MNRKIECIDPRRFAPLYLTFSIQIFLKGKETQIDAQTDKQSDPRTRFRTDSIITQMLIHYVQTDIHKDRSRQGPFCKQLRLIREEEKMKKIMIK